MQIRDILAELRTQMDRRSLDVLVVPSADSWLNEYVPLVASHRAALTGFTGSMGDVVFTQDRAILVVDGRYTLQAQRECPDFEVVTVPLGTRIEQGVLDVVGERLGGLDGEGPARVGAPFQTLSKASYAQLAELCTSLAAEVAPADELVESVRETIGKPSPAAGGQAWAIDPALSGRSVRQRIEELAPLLEDADLDGFVVCPLDEIAWLTNLRGDGFPFQNTFPARAILFRDRVLLEPKGAAWKNGTRPHPGENPEDGLTLGSIGGTLEELAPTNGRALRLGIDPGSTTAHVHGELAARGIELIERSSPVASLRVKKTPAELDHMVSAFGRADEVVHRLQRWVHREVKKKRAPTEAAVARKVEELFSKSGALFQSFNTIAGANEHGAIIHYGTPDDEHPIQRGSLFLLDCGAFYEGGLATDLTRTFLVGKGEVDVSKKVRRYFTLVLKAAIAGMSARFPRGTSGEQLDAIVRRPLWQAGLDYQHGTGHGVGVNVHEFPPRVAPKISAPVEEGHVFSIEPGLYLEGQLGIRIENLCVCVACPDDERFLRVRPLTFSPLDRRLILRPMLGKQERSFLSWFRDRWKKKDARSAPLPPLA